MNINRAGKQQKAYWRAEEKATSRWEKGDPETVLTQQLSGQLYQVAQERRIGFATGWIAAINWSRRNKK